MKDIELKPCPFCGGKVELKDKTSNSYGFNGYEIKCNCGCMMKSDLCSEMIFEGNKCSTPVTERGKSKALSDLVALWNGSADRKQSEWVPVSDPPKENGIYCVMVEHHKSRKCKQRTHARYKNGRWLDLYDNWENRCWDVTHWMPLPEPPMMKGGAE